MLELHTLGRHDLRRSDGRELLSLVSQPKRLLLLAYLAIGRPDGVHRRDTLVGLFWPELDQEHARNALNQAVHALRRVLGGQVLVSRGKEGISLSQDHLRCDAVAFERACDAGDFEAALRLYRGDLLEGFHLSGAPEFEHWLEAERERLRRLACEAALTLVDREEQRGDLRSAERWLRVLLALSPLDENSLRQLMTLLARSGDVAGAVRAYTDFAHQLKQEYDLQPSRETEALVESVRARPSDSLPAASSEPSRLSHIRESTGSARIRSLAVLPLRNLSTDPEQEYFADSMTEALIIEFGKIAALRVISRQSVMRYKGSAIPLRQIARELAVDGIVEGSVLHAAGRVRITAELIRALPEQHLWAESYDRELRNVLALQQEIARTVAREIRITLTPEEKKHLAQSRAVDPAAYEVYVKGRHFQHAQMGREIALAIKYFQRAIEIDPAFAPAYAGQAICYCTLSIFANLDARQAFPAAHRLAEQALALDEEAAEAHVALAYSEALFDWNWSAAERSFRRALALNPGSVDAQGYYGSYLTWMGRFAEALAAGKQTLRLAPLDLGASFLLGWMYHKAGRHEEAVEQLEQTLELYPSFAFVHAFLAASYVLTGRNMKARQTVRAGLEMLEDDQLSLGYGAWTLARAEERDGAVALLERLQALASQGWVDPYYLAVPYVGLGDADAALEWLRRTCDERSASAIHLRSDPLLDPIRADTRFEALMSRMKFPS
jgi:TolB-like protein/Tfp pilus assembly protein PilF